MWYKFHETTSISVVTGSDKFFGSLSQSLPSTELTLGAHRGRSSVSYLPGGEEAVLPEGAHMEPWHLQRCSLHLPEISHHSVSNGAWNFWLGPTEGCGFTTQSCILLVSSGWAGKLRGDDRFRIQLLLLCILKQHAMLYPLKAFLEDVGGSHRAPNKGVCANSMGIPRPLQTHISDVLRTPGLGSGEIFT